MSDAALGIWASLVRLAGTGKKTIEVDQENFQLPAVPGEEGVGTSRCPPIRPLLSPKAGGLYSSHYLTDTACNIYSYACAIYSSLH